MTDSVNEAELSVGPKAIDAYARLSYTMWFALAEFVDNYPPENPNQRKSAATPQTGPRGHADGHSDRGRQKRLMQIKKYRLDPLTLYR